MVLKRDVCIIPPGRWMGSFSLQRCQSDGFEVCQLHKKSQTKRVEKRYGVRIWGGKLMSVFYIRTCCGFLQNFATGVLFMGLMRSMRSRRKKNGWNVPVDLSQQNYCADCVRLLFQFAFVDFHMDVWAKLQQSAASSSKQASRRWMESESLNHSCRGGGLQSAPYLPFLIILNNLQFKEKSSYPVSHHQIMFFFYQRGEVQVFSCSGACRKFPVDCSQCWHSAYVQAERFCNAHRRVRNNGEANE